jgi:uncharacterized surface protein with fasciclin (FAS1) repeats
MQRRRSLSAMLVLVALAGAACGSSKDSATHPAGSTASTVAAPKGNVAAVAAYDAQLSTFATMLNVSGALLTVGARGPFTVFAPTNAAFAKLPHARLNALLSPAGRQDLRQLMLGNLVRGRLLAKDLKPGSLKTLSGASLTVTKRGDVVTLTDAHGRTAKVLSGPLHASNGVLYRTDAVFTRA